MKKNKLLFLLGGLTLTATPFLGFVSCQQSEAKKEETFNASMTANFKYLETVNSKDLNTATKAELTEMKTKISEIVKFLSDNKARVVKKIMEKSKKDEAAATAEFDKLIESGKTLQTKIDQVIAQKK